jgi:1-acyl-sn-glycerol-3-phosphate acyltransferase
VLNSFLYLFLWLFRIKIKVKNRETIDKIEGRFLLVSNHRSNYDPIVTYYAFRDKGMAFISKPENFKIPIAGKVIRKCCFLAIDRVNPRNAIKTLRKASDIIKNDEVSFGIYPEGTRSKDGNMLEFHDGVFKIAQNANVPVVVVTVKNTENIAKRKFWGKITTEIEIVDVIDSQTVSSKTTHELSAMAKESMLKNLC